MTRIEIDKCIKLMNEGIKAGRRAKALYADNSKETNERAADQEYGYALGINQALVVIGFKHKDMDVLCRLI